jgi:MEMO1 family protein
MFYSDKPQELAAAVRTFVTQAAPAPVTATPKAVIAPHAGYIYSGPIAGSAYAPVLKGGKNIERVLLLGPSHRVAFSGVATSSADGFETPVGPVRLDRDAHALLIKEGLARDFDPAHENEHSLEVQLPFLKLVCPDARIVPLLAGDDDWSKAAKILSALWGQEETLIVISSDLSHYHDYSTAQRLDAATARTIERLGAGAVTSEQACGATAINALLAVIADKGLACTTLDLRNSGDTAGSRDRVVGYGAFAVGAGAA